MAKKISRIHVQKDLSPRSLMLACAEGLLGELVKNARLGFSDIVTEEPLHHTVQLIASARGYHHHHEYPVIKTQGPGDHKRLDFVFTRLANRPKNSDGSNNFSVGIALEMKVLGRRCRNFPPTTEDEVVSVKRPKLKTVTKDIAKVHHFLTQTVPAVGIPESAGFLMVVNLDYDSGIQWEVTKAGGVREQDVSLVERYIYSRGLIHKSVTVYEVRKRDQSF